MVTTGRSLGSPRWRRRTVSDRFRAFAHRVHPLVDERREPSSASSGVYGAQLHQGPLVAPRRGSKAAVAANERSRTLASRSTSREPATSASSAAKFTLPVRCEEPDDDVAREGRRDHAELG